MPSNIQALCLKIVEFFCNHGLFQVKLGLFVALRRGLLQDYEELLMVWRFCETGNWPNVKRGGWGPPPGASRIGRPRNESLADIFFERENHIALLELKGLGKLDDSGEIDRQDPH